MIINNIYIKKLLIIYKFLYKIIISIIKIYKWVIIKLIIIKNTKTNIIIKLLILIQFSLYN